MKNIIRGMFMIFTASILWTSCSKFEEINTDPLAASADQVQVEYFLNNSIIGAQQDPHVAERAFVIYWKTASRQQFSTGIAGGNYDDSWSSDYYNYAAGWLNNANTAIQIADEQIANGTSKTYTNNLKQVGRIWRAYLMSELADTFGPIPVEAFKAENPDFSSLQDVYYFLLSELKEAVDEIDEAVVNPSSITDLDQAYGYDYAKWIKYGNSMRMRLAMRLSEVDQAKAKTEFEDAASSLSEIITAMDDAFQVAERPGWDPLTGVMSREWNAQPLSATMNNLYLGLGGIQSEDQLAASFHSAIKPANYIGLKFENHWTTMTNDPSAGFWLDGLPKIIDPRAYKSFIIPGDFNNPNFNRYPSWDNSSTTVSRTLIDENANVVKTINATNTWNAPAIGDWGVKGSKNFVRNWPGAMPRLSHRFRGSESSRIFFAPWETHFLLAEAAIRGWTVPMSGKAAYEAGIASSFEYFGVSQHLPSYTTSTNYNRVGTSVSWDHTIEPPATHTMTFENGYTGANGTTEVKYPVNTMYKGGSVNNDLLTKVITQKYIAQLPWLPLEAWSDHRRLGLPFFENPAVESPLPGLPGLNSSNFMTNSPRFYPQRLRYPSGLRNSNPEGYEQAVGFLGGEDAVLTPLWWAQKP